MSNSIESIRKINAALGCVVPVSEASLKIDLALSKPCAAAPAELQRRGRIIFCLDLTSSREAALHQARLATAAMFDAIKAIGDIIVRLAYFRGASECRTSGWSSNPLAVSSCMQKLTCKAGKTQIARLLRMVLDEPEEVSGVVFIGDHCEDDASELRDLARKVGKRGIPIFLFHECAALDTRCWKAKPTFRHIAEYSGGVYVEFKPDSGDVLRELLTNVAAFSARGPEGVMQVALPVTEEARQLRGRLLLGSGAGTER